MSHPNNINSTKRKREAKFQSVVVVGKVVVYFVWKIYQDDPVYVVSMILVCTCR